MKRSETANEIKILREIAIQVSKKAHSPYSNAKVGCAVLTSSGRIFSGCNVENSSYGATICAERCAIFTAVASGEKKLNMIYIYTNDGWPPCGMCRQVMTEFSGPDLKIVIGSKKGKDKIFMLKEILPLAFNQKHLKK